MERVNPRVPPLIWQLFSPLLQIHFSVGAVLAGTARGEVWVDDPNDPQVGYAITPEGHYLAGNGARADVYPELRKLIPHSAYLVFEPGTWEPVLNQVWDNPFARQHNRWNYQLESLQFTDWIDHIPKNFQLAPVNRELLEKKNLENFREVSDRIMEWESTEDFLQRGFGFCILHKHTIASRCIVDCVEGILCELGVGTDIRYRQRGLASVVVAATVTEALSRGYQRVGWHCLESNTGSMLVAEKVGFIKKNFYTAYSSELPSENAGDLPREEYMDWARHYEQASKDRPVYNLFAAGAWALSGNSERALENLEHLVHGAWEGEIKWVEDNWMLSSLRDTAAFVSILARLREKKQVKTDH